MIDSVTAQVTSSAVQASDEKVSLIEVWHICQHNSRSAPHIDMMATISDAASHDDVRRLASERSPKSLLLKDLSANRTSFRRSSSTL
jgi:hypothetical protein